MSADAESDIVAIAAQPLALLWARGTSGHHDHVPDFFVRLSNGDGRVVDVRPPERVEKNAEQFALTRKACDEIGWHYEVFTGLASEHAHNLRWLAGYRHDRNVPSKVTAELIRHNFEQPVPLEDGVRRLTAATGLSSEVLTANVLHLIWRQMLSTDLSRPLSMSSEVWA